MTDSTETDLTEKKPLSLPLILSGLGLLAGCGLIGLMIVLIVVPTGTESAPEPTDFPTLQQSDRNLVFPTATQRPTEAPSSTPTETPTEEEESTPTETEQPTDTPAPTSDSSSDEEPLSTDTPEPTETTAPPAGIPGLTGVNFWVDNPSVPANVRIVFNFTVTNSGTEPIVFGPLGVVVYNADGVNVYFQSSWPRWELGVGETKAHDDGVTIGTPGTYTLQLSACIPYDGQHCDSGGGDWHILSAPVIITIN